MTGDFTRKVHQRVYLDAAMRKWLTPRESFVVRARADGYTLQEIGWAVGCVTGSRVAQIEARAFRKLMHPHCKLWGLEGWDD